MSPRRTVIVQGALAFGTRRRHAALSGEIGTAIVTLPQLAAALAGGFLRLAPSEVIEPITQRLAAGGFEDLEEVRDLPGMTRAVMSVLRKVWQADFDLRKSGHAGKARVKDLIAIEDHVRANLPAGTLLAPDLSRAALARIGQAPRVLGPVRLESIHYVEPVWRPLIIKLRDLVPIEWHVSSSVVIDWFDGQVIPDHGVSCAPERLSCANPQHEALEALRWARSLMASGRATSAEIAICAASTEDWDEHILALSREMRGLSSSEGQ